MRKISVLGCGWLGLPLAAALKENEFEVNGSTTSKDKLPVLENNGIEPFLISLGADAIQGNIGDFLQDSEILIVDIPPKLRDSESESFISKIQTLIPLIEISSVDKVIFISSTSVYADNNAVVDENTEPDANSESGKQLYAAEKILLRNSAFKTTVIRFGGLVGAERHPVYSLSGKQSVAHPTAPINLIDRRDCIGIILKIIQKEAWNKTFNAVSPCHISREVYYTKKSAEKNLERPVFDHTKPSVGKIVLSEKLQRELEYKFLVTTDI